MRSRQHVVIARLNDEEYEIYQRLLRRVYSVFHYPENDSEAFRLALKVLNEKLKQEAFELFYQVGLDI